MCSDWAELAERVEDQITYPLVTNLQGLPGVRTVRASSASSFSMVNVIFEDDVSFAGADTDSRASILFKGSFRRA